MKSKSCWSSRWAEDVRAESVTLPVCRVLGRCPVGVLFHDVLAVWTRNVKHDCRSDRAFLGPGRSKELCPGSHCGMVHHQFSKRREKAADDVMFQREHFRV